MLVTLDRIHWLTECATGFYLDTDHNNLVFLFDPRAFVSEMSQPAFQKVLHCTGLLELVHITIYALT